MADETRADQAAGALSGDDLLGMPGCDIERLPMPELGEGRYVEIRGLTKLEVQQCRERAKKDGEVDEDILEREFFLTGLVAPKLTVAQYEALIAKPAGLYYRIANPILKKSGLWEEVRRKAKKDFLPGR